LEEKAPAQVIGGPRWVVQAELRVAAAAVARDRVDLLEMTVRVADGKTVLKKLTPRFFALHAQRMNECGAPAGTKSLPPYRGSE